MNRMELAFEAHVGSANHLVLGPRNLQPGVRSKFFDVRVEGPDTMRGPDFPWLAEPKILSRVPKKASSMQSFVVLASCDAHLGT